jgi:demethylmenaquinone methyltransferase/2-methoxy-6-polyprenyl-1,4-benzoquinol methylase
MGASTSTAPGTLEETQVRAMFDRIARLYDRMNTVMTAGLHHQWRRRAADLAAVSPGDRVLDVATGTGDLALELAGRVAPGGEVIGVDFSERMLELARTKADSGRTKADSGRPKADSRRTKADSGRPNPSVAAPEPPVRTSVQFSYANALDLPYPDDSFAAATVGFGARNFSDLEQGLREMARVVRPGGHVVILEITTPRRPPLSTFFELWFDRVVPALGRIAGDSQAYSYLPNSVRRFPGPEDLAATMSRCGLSAIRYVLTAGGIIAMHVGKVVP